MRMRACSPVIAAVHAAWDKSVGWGIAALMLALLSPVTGFAGVVVFGNLGPTNNVPNDPNYEANSTNTVGSYRDIYRAIGFTTGTSVSLLNITSLSMVVGDGENGPLPTIEIMTTSGTEPSGTAIASWTIQSLASGENAYELASPGISLSPSTNYWVVLHDSNAVLGAQVTSLYQVVGYQSPDAEGTFTSNFAAAQNGSGYTPYLAGYKLNGGSWRLGGLGSNFYGTTAGMGLSITASPVPEINPASLGSAFALLMGSLGLVERRARRALGLTTVA